MLKFFSCYIISETSLGIQCAEALIKDGHKLVGIISPDNKTKQWALQNDISYISSIEEFQKLIASKSFDYLFSIVNNHILPKSFLQLPRYYAINYHDAPLPKYAGVHSTSWAILNNESVHGITWHIMDEVVDRGNILKQITFNIEVNETAISLNLKCYLHALDAFKKLIKDLAQGPLIGVKQDLKKRSYFSLHQKPPTFGFVCWESSADDIDRQYRALSFGEYHNALTSFKLLINKNVYIPANLEVLTVQSKFSKGTIVNITDRKIQISTKTRDINLSYFRTLEGNLRSIKDIVKDNGIYVGYKLRDPSRELIKQLQEFSKDISLSESFWKESFINTTQASFVSVSSNPRKLAGIKKKEKKPITYTKSFLNSSNCLIEEENIGFADILTTAFLIYLNYLGNSYPFTIGFINSFLNTMPKESKILFPAHVPLTCYIPSNLNVCEIVKYIRYQIEKIEKNKAYFKDILVRYPDLPNNCLNLPIIINIGNFKKIKNDIQESTLLFNIDNENKTCTLHYKKDCNEITETIFKNFSEHIGILFHKIIESPKQTLDHFCILTPQEKRQILIEWNATEKDYPSDKTIPELFEKQVEKTPNNIALVYEGTKLTYRELNERANQLAHYLKSKQEIKPDTLIALCLDRSEHMLIAILGILKAGGAYVPMDPSYPDERIGYILKDTNTQMVLVDESYLQRLGDLSDSIANKPSIVAIDQEQMQQQLKTQLATNLNTTTISTSLAYVIYTSGTTGNPKGVMIEHRGVVNRIKWMSDKYPLNEADKILQKTPYVFDVSVWELLWANWYGACLVFAKPEVHKDANSLIDLMNKEFITITHFVPSMLSIFEDTFKSNLERLGVDNPIPSLRYIFCSGEVLDLSQVQVCHSILPNTELHNLYGPTEASVDVLYYDCTDRDIEAIYIGKPIDNTIAYVLNSNLSPLPIGAVGELYIGGVGLARGYLNRAELTVERFIANPFQTEEEKAQNKNARLYKTGDLVRWSPDGNIEYIGRNDFQVKIRGYRIELGEIENAFSSYAGVKQSVVLAKEHTDGTTAGNKYLVGYYVSEQILDQEGILKYLRTKLPEYMVPSILMRIDKLPLTLNGKLDRKALPDPEFTDTDSYVGPRNEVEQKVCQIWSEVLGLAVDKISINDDFFRLGGNSISAIRLVSRLNKALNTSISVSSIFKQKTISNLAHSLVHNKEDNIVIEHSKISKAEGQALSFAQERLWFIEQYESGTNAYNIPMVFKLSDGTELDILAKSISSIVNRHEVLRTLIKQDNEGNGYQSVLDDPPLQIQRIKVTNQLVLDEELNKEINHIYDLSTECPIRVQLYQLINKKHKTAAEYYISIVVHHIAFDGWSTNILLQELEAYYHYHLEQSQGLTANLNLPGLSIQYKDFALWQRSYLTGDRLNEQLNYWQNKLSDHESLNLITDKVRPSQTDYSGSDVYFELDDSISISLRELAKELEVSLYSLLLAGYYLMLRVYSNQDDIVIGMPAANRHYPQVEHLIGFFVNSLALRTTIDPNTTLKGFIQKVGEEVVQAQLHQDLPFEKLVEELNITKDTSRHPIFQVMFSTEGFGEAINDNNQQTASVLEPYTGSNAYNVAKFDISSFIDDSQLQLRGSFNYAVSLYTEETITSFIKTYKYILEQFTSLLDNTQKQEKVTISQLSYLPLDTYQQVVNEWNNTDREYPDNKTIHKLFEEQVGKTPNNIAIVYEETKLTYRELNNKANQLANYLRGNYQIKPDSLIALCLDRSEHMLIAILAVLKAGGAYVPMDPSYPDERISYILSDTQAKIVLSNEVYQGRLLGLAELDSIENIKSIESFGGSDVVQTRQTTYTAQEEQTTQTGQTENSSTSRTIAILAIDSAGFQKQCSLAATINQITTTASTNLAYVIYTSGTTGNPKGVMIEHKGVVNIKYDLTYKYQLDDENNKEVILQLANYIFDASVEQIILSLLNGHALVLVPNQLWLDKDRFYSYLNSYKVTHVDSAPTFLAQYDFSKALSLQRLICGGELFSKDCYNNLILSNNKKIINVYGPTEASITSIINIIKDNNLSIGKPIANTQAYILDANLNPLPIGAIGELYIGGVGLARGYLNRPDLTAEKFIKNPFQSKTERDNKSYGPLGKNAKLYKTGDLVRYLPDGNIEYIGRNDFQVKIRGYRIELGEIENAFSSYAGIKQSVVLAKEHTNGTAAGNKYLVGYYVSEQILDQEGILKYLRTKLPEYMVPSILMRIDKLPLTLNGKLDRKALPDPEFTDTDSYVGPRNEVEQKVCQIWSEVLGLAADKISINDDFFRLGGDSIISIQLVSRLRQRLGLSLSIKDIFSYKTIARLYDNVLSKVVDAKELSLLKTEQGLLSGEVALLPIQDWFFVSNLTKPDYWNQSFIVKTPALDIVRLSTSIEMLVAHHDCLRMRYKRVQGSTAVNNNYIQYYATDVKPARLQVLDIRTLKAKEGSKAFATKLQNILTSWQSGFSLEDGLLYNIGYIYGYADGSARISFALHHLIVDAVSWRILTEDLSNIYQGRVFGLKASSYRQWVAAVQEYGRVSTNEQDYWHNILSDYDHDHRLTKLVTNEATLNYTSFELDQEQTRLLLQESNRAYNTEINDLLLTALGYALAALTKSNTNHIVLEGHGREEIDHSLDITRTVGWFTTMYPVRLGITADIATSLKHIKESLRQVPNKGIGYGAIVGYRSELPRISFNYLGQFNQAGQKQKQDQESWHITDEHSGVSMHAANQDYNILNINGLVIDGCLKFSIGSKLDKDITNTVGEFFKHQLTELIKHTVSQTRSYLTTSDVNNIISQEYLDKLQSSKEVEGVYLANSLQQGFIYHALNQGDVDDAYRVQLIWEYHNAIDLAKLKEVWSYAQARYPTLRLRLTWDEELVQVIDKEGKLDWRYIDLSKEQDFTIQEQKIKQIQEEDRFEVYQLEQGNLFRVYIIKQQADLYTCIFSNHHAIIDGWSVPVLLNYIHDTYTKLLNQETIPLSVDHSYEEAQKYLQANNESNKDYWHNYIARIEERVDLSGLLSNENRSIRISEYKHIKEPQEATLTIKDKLYTDLKEISQKEGVTLNAILQYIWHKILSIYGNNSKTIVGTTVSGRNLPIDNIESSVGLYINTLPLIVDHSNPEQSIIALIKEIQADINEINTRSDITLAKLQSSVAQQGGRLFDSLFVYENYPNPTNAGQQSNLKIEFKEAIEKLDYPLGIIGYEDNNQLTFRITYAGELFVAEAIARVLKVSEKLLEQITNNPDQLISQLNYLPLDTYQQVINEWNNTDREYPDNKTIHKLFEEQVGKTPNNIAIVYEETKLTYRELNNKANQLANYLRGNYQIKPDSLIALCLDRSEHMLIAILAVLKAGGAYVPMDPSYPDERISYILSDTQAKIVLSNEVYQGRLLGLAELDSIENIKSIESFGGSDVEQLRQTRHTAQEEQTENSSISETIAILAIDSTDLQKQCSLVPTINPTTTTASTNLAYVIYTSGTTGNPKGVMIEHKGVVNIKYDLTYKYQLDDENNKEVILQLANYIFDASVEQIILSLLNGHALVLVPNQLWLDKDRFYSYLNSYKVTHVDSAPTFLAQYDFSKALSLQRLICGGELFSKDCYNNLILSNNKKIINVYGPTEASITSIINIIKDNNLSIGKPIANTQAYILDANLNPLPIGAIGELYIGGVGLARGYLNRPDLTAEKFITNPFQSKAERDNKSYGPLGKNAKLYKTGDLVRYLPDGNIEYIGRNDFQVKIRGYRIELGEIEGVLSSYAGIKQSVVLAKEHTNGTAAGNKYLVGYYVSEQILDQEGILKYLQTKLPEYMVPSILMRIDKLPLTLNGKLDRKALPDPEFTDTDSYVGPRNEVEQKVCQIWSEVLGLAADKISINDDFFRLGGDSIISIQLVSRLRQRLGLSLSIKDIFSYKTIARLYDNVLSKVVDAKELSLLKTEQGLLSGEVALLPIQDWFFVSNLTKPDYWNQSFIVKTPALDIVRLSTSIEMLVAHHDCLRMRYKRVQGSTAVNNNYIQYYATDVKPARLQVLDIRTLKAKEGSKAFATKLQNILTSWQSGFSLEDGLLYNIGYIYGYADGSARISFALHHLIVDAVSWRILTEDLSNIYQGRVFGLKASSYRQWVAAVQEYGRVSTNEQDYWHNILSDYDHDHRLTKLVTNEATLNYTSFELDQEQTRLLLQESNRAYNTEINDLLLTALGYALAALTKSNTNHIVLEGHGREEIDHSLDITRTVGWFTTMYPVRLGITADIATSLKHIKESLRQVPNKGIGYGAIVGYRSELPRISFNYLGQFNQAGQKQKQDQESWHITDEHSGVSMHAANQDYNILNINGLVIDGYLKFSIGSKLDEESTNCLAIVFQNELQKIISYCIGRKKKEYTMSDLKDYTPYIICNNSKEIKNNTLFIFPPGGGGAESYMNNVVPILANNKLVLFNNFLMELKAKYDKGGADHVTFEMLAQDYIQYMKFIQITGPYNLFGWSFGGVLAFEITRQLLANGESVNNLFLLDPYFNYKKVLNKLSIKTFKNDINYKYSPKFIANTGNLKITLFKAMKTIKIDSKTLKNKEESNEIKVAHYFTLKTQYNNLDYLISKSLIQLVPINADHDSCIKHKSLLEILQQGELIAKVGDGIKKKVSD